MAERLEIDIATGEAKLVALTATELAARAAEQQAAATAHAIETTQRGNEITLRDRADQAIATLDNAHTNWATLTAAQKDAALKLTVRVTIALARLVLRRLEAT